MKTYHVFIIKQDIYIKYINKQDELYKILYSLYHLNKKNIQYGIQIYNQLCCKINKEKIIKYINQNKNIKKINQIIIINNEIIIIKPSRIIIKTTKLTKNITTILAQYNKNFFICDFKLNNYNWINNEIN